MPVAALLVGRIVGHDRRPFRLILGHALAGYRRMRVIPGAENPTYVAGLAAETTKLLRTKKIVWCSLMVVELK